MDLLSISEKKAHFWLKQTVLEPSAQADIKNLLDLSKNGNSTELVESFCQELSFGTAGLRGIVGTGSNKLNIYNARKVAQSLAMALKKQYQNSSLTVLLGCDSRLSSELFLNTCREILEANHITCYAFSCPTPTPLLSFAIRNLKAQAGLMITASHNPKDYNGIKVYGQDGAQVTSPLDEEIMDYYQSMEENWGLIATPVKLPSKFISETIFQEYINLIEAEIFQKDLIKKEGKHLKIVYTPLHGTGASVFVPLMKQLGFSNFEIVSSQEKPDGDFPTAPKPNPEEPAALELACELMLKSHADFAIGNDPDADRMGIIANDKSRPYFLTGNEINILMLHYKLEQLQTHGSLPANSIVLKSLVSSPMQDAICQYFGVTLFATLTGFKWMAKKIHDLETTGTSFSFIFASEESFGSMSHKNVRDKDGLSSAALFTEMALWHKSQGRSIVEALDYLYTSFGLYFDQVFSFNLPGVTGMQKMQNLMDTFRNEKEGKEKFFGTTDCLVNITDYSKENDGLPPSNLLKLNFASKTILYIRPSGTEPKIKFYVMLQDHSQAELSLKKKLLKHKADLLKTHLDFMIKESSK